MPLLASTLGVLALVFAVSASAAPSPRTATGQLCTILGTSKADLLRGTDGPDVICGLGGNDKLYGLNGNDILDGGTGDDVLDGGTGIDYLIGGAGHDRLIGSKGRNLCVADASDRSTTACLSVSLSTAVRLLSGSSTSPSPKPTISPTPTPTLSPTPSPSPSQSASATPTAPPGGQPGGSTTPVGILLNFDTAVAGQMLTDFGGESSVVTGNGVPSGGNGVALSTRKGDLAWAGVTFFQNPNGSAISSTGMTISGRVWAPAAGKLLRLKVESSVNGGISVETDAVTSSFGWQNLTWNFANPAAGTTPYAPANTYDRVTIFPEFGSTTPGGTYWLDDFSLPGAIAGTPAGGSPSPTPTLPNSPLALSTLHTLGNLLWSDDFAGANGAAVSTQNWTLRYCNQTGSYGGGTCYNSEQQAYIPGAIGLDGQGSAVITTDKVAGTPTGATCGISNCQFTSGRMDTQGKVSFQYGYIEARMKMPIGAGNWPAFWMLGDNISSVGWPVSGEIDIGEQGGDRPTRNSSAVHYSIDNIAGSCCGNHVYDSGEIIGQANYGSDYHTYGLAWTPDNLEFYVDRVRFWSLSRSQARTQYWVFNQPFFVILNNAVGPFGGNYDGSWTQSKTYIDYVKAWQLDGVGSVTTR